MRLYIKRMHNIKIQRRNIALSNLLQPKADTSRVKLQYLQQRVTSNYYSIKRIESIFIGNNGPIYY